MENTIFVLEENSPKYKQIYERFKSFIERIDIPPNDPLPSIRQLADSLQVSHNTIRQKRNFFIVPPPIFLFIPFYHDSRR